MSDIDRRRFLKRSLIAGGAMAVPAIITMAPASATEIQSPPPRSTKTHQDPSSFHYEPHGSSDFDVTITRDERSGVTNNFALFRESFEGVVRRGYGSTGDLPKTGANIDKEALAGLTAIAGGVALRYWHAASD